MHLERLLMGPHEDRLAEVRRLTGETPPARMPEGEPAAGDEERLRVAMVRLLPRASGSDEACVRLLHAIEELGPLATTDVRALDAWHITFETAIERGLDPQSDEFGIFLLRYGALLEVWLARGA